MIIIIVTIFIVVVVMCVGLNVRMTEVISQQHVIGHCM